MKKNTKKFVFKQDSIPLEEQETVIQISRDSGFANIWTSDRTMITKIRKRMELPDSKYQLINSSKTDNGRIVVMEVKCPKKFVHLNMKERPKRELSEDQREILRKRFRKAREKTES